MQEAAIVMFGVQDMEEPPSKRLTEPADILRMPVSKPEVTAWNYTRVHPCFYGRMGHFQCTIFLSRPWRACSTRAYLSLTQRTIS